MKHLILIANILIFSLATILGNAQEGTVAGTVMDGDFNEPLAFSNILVKGTTTGVSSDFDGKYQLDLEAGTYTLVFSFVGYETKEISDVLITANKVTTIDVTLSTNSLETVVISTSVKRNTENAVLDFQKKSVAMVDGLSAQSIKKTGAGDLASAVKSVPGVSVQGGKYVYVRGLGDRYTKSILNGVDIPGLDPDRNTIQMDIFPTNILDNIIVIKSAAAEYPADFTGGVVDIVTKDFPTKAEYSVSIGAGYNPDMHFNDSYLTYENSSTDFLGFDNNERKRPIHRYQPIPGTFNNSEVLTLTTDAFNKELQAKRENSGMDFSFGLTAGNQYTLSKNQKIGYQVSLSYKNNTSFYKDRVDGTYTKDEQNLNNNDLLETRTTLGDEGINNVLLNGLAGIVYKTEKSKYKLNFLHIQNGESSAGFYNQLIAQAGGGSGLEPVQKDALLYTERAITNVLLNGNHNLGEEGDWKLDWKFSPTLSTVYDKDHRITPLQESDEGVFAISPSASSYPIRIWRTLLEENWSGKIDLDKKYELGGRPAKLKFGTAYTYKFRDFSIDDYTFQVTAGVVVPDGNPDFLLSSENIWTPQSGVGTHLVFGDQFNPNDAYEGEQQIFAAYVSNEFNLSEKFKAIVGLRTESFKSFYTGQDGLEVFQDAEVLNKFDFFPSANFIYAVNDETNFRTSYSRTTARPSFKEASSSQIFDAITNRLFIGNLNVRPSYINNFDLRYEFFGEEGQMYAISGFYKDFTDPIELSFFGSAPDQLTPRNLGNANVLGAEIELRQALGFISEDLKNLKFNMNASIIKSELNMFDDEYNRRVSAARVGENVERERDLQGQSPYLINAGLDYSNDDKGLRAGMFFNVQGSTLEVVGTGIVPDVYTKPFKSLNFTLNKAFGENKNSSIDFKISNVLGSKRESIYESFRTQDQIFSLRDPGTEFSIGYAYKF